MNELHGIYNIPICWVNRGCRSQKDVDRYIQNIKWDSQINAMLLYQAEMDKLIEYKAQTFDSLAYACSIRYNNQMILMCFYEMLRGAV